MNNQLSNKIKTTSLILMIMVVFLHSYNIDIKQGGKVLFFEKGFNWMIQNFISNGVTRIAVPMFFIISGSLFISKPTFDFQDYKIKISKRFKTLIVPYFCWTLFGLFFYFILQSIPASQGFFTKKLIKDYSFYEWVNAIIKEPIPYQLWFLKDLIVMVFLSPIIYFLVKKLNIIFVLIIFSFWIFNQDTIFLTSEALLFFSIGIYVQYFNKEIISKSNKYTQYVVITWLLLLLIKTTLGFYDFPLLAQQLFLKAAILTGIIAFWNLIDNKFYLKNIDTQIKKITGFAFFIYVFHEPFLTIIKKAMFSQLAKTPNSYLLVYLLAPIIVIIISVLVAVFLNKKMLFIYKIITGNR
ncbi:MAG: acyltransferase [Flavobacterium sp.]|nr:acyltransferase [Flavobacterium sp.]